MSTPNKKWQEEFEDKFCWLNVENSVLFNNKVFNATGLVKDFISNLISSVDLQARKEGYEEGRKEEREKVIGMCEGMNRRSELGGETYDPLKSDPACVAGFNHALNTIIKELKKEI